MELSALVGNERLKETLSRQFQARGLSHAYLIAGESGTGRHTLAELLAETALCQGKGPRPCGQCVSCKKVRAGIHPDVIHVKPQPGKAIAVDQIRQLRGDAYIRPNEGERKIYLIDEADQMGPGAQNALLKLLEEGPDYALFLLITENIQAMLETIRSRCEVLSLVPLPQETCQRELAVRFPHLPQEEIIRAARQCRGALGQGISLLSAAEEKGVDRDVVKLAETLMGEDELALFEASMILDGAKREDVVPMLSRLLLALEGNLARPEVRPRAVKAMELVKDLELAARQNVAGPQLAGWLCAGMFSCESLPKRDQR